MRFAWVIVVAAVGVPVLAQVTAEEARQRMEQKEKERQAHRAEKMTITRGELEDLKAEIARLKSELQQLKGQASQANTLPAPDPEIKFVTRIETGVSRQQLLTFVAQHKDRYRITRDVHSESDELVALERYMTKQVEAGRTSNGVNVIKQYKNEKISLKSWDLVLRDGKIVDISGDPGVIE